MVIDRELYEYYPDENEIDALITQLRAVHDDIFATG